MGVTLGLDQRLIPRGWHTAEPQQNGGSLREGGGEMVPCGPSTASTTVVMIIAETAGQGTGDDNWGGLPVKCAFLPVL